MCAINRLTGMATGLDTDTTVKNMMKAENIRLDKLNQRRQRVLWTQEGYRDVISNLRTFQSKRFDILKPELNIGSTAFFSKFDSSVKSTATGITSTAVTATGTPALTTTNLSIDSISQLATKDTFKSAATDLSTIKSQAIDASFGASGETLKFSLTVDGITKNIELSSTLGIDSADSLSAALKAAIGGAFGSASYENIVKSDGNSIMFGQQGSKVTVLAATGFESSLSRLGITSGASSTDALSAKISDSLGITNDDLAKMKINGKSLSEMGINADTSITSLISKVNADTTANVTMSYSTIDGKFSIVADAEGTANRIDMKDEGTGLWGSRFKFADSTGTGTYAATVAAKNAILTVGGTQLEKASNSFNIDGINIKLNAASETPIEINMKNDTSAVMDKVKSFVEDYNKMIEDLNTKLGEKYYRDFPPLTDEQKKEMKEDDIKKWEEKAKSGLLRNSGEIKNMMNNLQRALFDKVEEAGISVFEVGINLSKNYKDGGKIELDEAKFKNALENNYDKVVSLFTNRSDKAYGDGINKAERYKESGLADRINDVLQDAVRTTRLGGKYKGSLIEKAGITGDTSINQNSLSEQLKLFDERIIKTKDILAAKETRYYAMFARMEKMMQNMNAQSQSLGSLIGGGK